MSGSGSACGKREFFGSLAEEWEKRGFTPEELPKVERLRARLGDLSGLTVFEPGCGTGRLTERLAEWVGPSGRVIAVEISREMVEGAVRTVSKCAGVSLGVDAICRLDPTGTRGAVEIHCGRAESFEIPAASLDLALLFCVFPHFDDKAAALRRFRALLRPEGRLVIAHLEGSERLNTMHEGAGEPVRRDRIPPADVLLGWLRGADLNLRTLVDWDEEFYLEAVPASV